MYFDGSVKKEGAGVGLVFISPLGMCMEYMVRLHFPTSNNAAEYEALINSKWIEARPIINIRSEEAVSFFTDIIYRFDIPNTIITDKGTQFTGKKFLNFCDDC
jgi:ribonuclease HI